MSIICEEFFDEVTHPSEEEVKDYALKIGIDPDSEPQLLPIAAEGLMKALPPGWKPWPTLTDLNGRWLIRRSKGRIAGEAFFVMPLAPLAVNC